MHKYIYIERETETERQRKTERRRKTEKQRDRKRTNLGLVKERDDLEEGQEENDPERVDRIFVVVAYLGDFLFINSLVDPVLNTICVVGDFIPPKNVKIKTQHFVFYTFQ